MKTISLDKRRSTEAQSQKSELAVIRDEGRVLQACRDAAAAERDYAMKALFAGCLLIEFRASLAELPSNHKAVPSHSGTGLANSSNYPLRHGRNTPPEDRFAVWLAQCNLARSTAYRWMEAAERIARKNLGLLETTELPTVIDVEGVAVPLSQALTAPEAELSGKALAFRQSVFDFMENKTLAEAARAAFEGESPAHRISRAAGGKTHGGAPDLGRDPEARKAHALFAGRALSEAMTHIGARVNKQGGHWPGLSQAQKQEAREYLRLFVAGLDDDALAVVAEAARDEIANRRKGDEPRPLLLRRSYERSYAAKFGQSATRNPQSAIQ